MLDLRLLSAGLDYADDIETDAVRNVVHLYISVGADADVADFLCVNGLFGLHSVVVRTAFDLNENYGVLLFVERNDVNVALLILPVAFKNGVA